MKDEFKIITREKKTFENGLSEIIAIEFREPTMIKFESDEPLKDGELLEVRGSYVYHNGIQIGKIKIMKSANDVKASHNFDIKYTGGYSLDGTTIFLDEHFPEEIEVENKKINTMLTIGYHHELPEKWLSDEKFEYPYAHEKATGIEKEFVESLGVTWKGYCSVVDRNLRNVYSKTLEKSPPSLDLAPYLYCRDKEALNEIRKSSPE
ncbi:MAG: hypothetical protein M1427_01925 [Candidatus Thermoplasmatota archaeon]|nr:hypothetical protein [Candidatus Thermoplasmatota archaeon]